MDQNLNHDCEICSRECICTPDEQQQRASAGVCIGWRTFYETVVDEPAPVGFVHHILIMVDA